MSIDGPTDLQGLRRAGAAVAAARDAMAAAVAPGVTTAWLDAIGAEVLRAHGARSAPRLAYDFPGDTCVSVNATVAHGIPSAAVVLRDGDLVNIDVSAELDGYWADTGVSLPVGEISDAARHLLDTTREALADALRQVHAGAPVRGIGRAVERRAQRAGLRVLRNLNGHGIGRHIHEPPSIPNVWDPRNRDMLTEGMVITVEPFLAIGADRAVGGPDGWALNTEDGGLAAQFEHTLVVTGGAPIILT